MRRTLVVGNWKMHGSFADNADLLAAISSQATGFPEVESAVCAPFPYLAQVRELLAGTPVKWGAQNSSEHVAGAYTGEVSPAMLREFGCHYVIVGHSERRTLHHETDALVGAKAVAVLSNGMTPIVCVGETLDEREAGHTAQVVTRQLDAIIAALGADALARVVIAYEPIWAIGTGRSASPEQAQAVHALIRQRLAGVDAGLADDIRILYGGSLKPGNAGALFAQPDIDGGLVGGASLVAADFVAIIMAGQSAQSA